MPEPNEGKKLAIEVRGASYSRYPVFTPLVSDGDDITRVIKEYTAGMLLPGDLVVVCERVVAVSQNRSFRIEDIRPRGLARVLSRFVYRHPGGIGLRSPHTMQLAIQEAGVPRILLASAVSIVGKLFGRRGLFYRVAGHNVASIDGPCHYTLPPGNVSAKLGPLHPDQVAQGMADELGASVAVIDANDYGRRTLGVSRGVDPRFVEEVFADNPLGQSHQQTPLAIVRKDPRVPEGGTVSAGLPDVR